MMILKKAILTILIVFGCIACDSQKDVSDQSSIDLSTKLTSSSLKLLDGTNWVFTNYAKNQTNPEYANEITLLFGTTTNEEIRYSGKSIVNLYGGTFTVEKESGLLLHNEDGITTLIGTENQQLATLEVEYYSSINKAKFFIIKDNILRIYLGDISNEDTEILIYRKK